MTNTLVAAAVSLLSGSFSPEVRTAYVSRGKVVDDRPIQANTFRLQAKLGEDEQFGRLGIYHFDYSALTPRTCERCYQFMREFNWGVTYRYDWRLAEEWTLESEVMPYWTLFPAMDPGLEWWVIQSLRNPYLIPTWWMRRGTEGYSFTYFRLGVLKPFPLATCGVDCLRPLTVTLAGYAELGNSELMTARYGEDEDGNRLPTGIQSLVWECRADYALADWLGVYLALQQFDLVNPDARRQSHTPNRRDLTILTLGLTFHF